MALATELTPATESAFNEASEAEHTAIRLVKEGATGDRIADAEQYADHLWQLFEDMLHGLR